MSKSVGIELTAEERKFIVDSILERTWEYQKERIEDLSLLSVPRAAGMLDLSTVQARRVLTETIDFGPQNTRVSFADLKKVIEERRVSKKKKRRKP